MARYDDRLKTFFDLSWVSRGYAQPESLARYGFSVFKAQRDLGNLTARCSDCHRTYDEGNYLEHWIFFHDEHCVFRDHALYRDSLALFAVQQKQKLLDQNRVITGIRQEIQALRHEVDALKLQNQALEKKLDDKQALEKEVEEYASVKTALLAALGR